MNEIKLDSITINKNQGNISSPWLIKTTKKKKSTDEFKTILESYLTEAAEELDEHRVLFPRHHHFWDNGYEDVG